MLTQYIYIYLHLCNRVAIKLVVVFCLIEFLYNGTKNKVATTLSLFYCDRRCTVTNIFGNGANTCFIKTLPMDNVMIKPYRIDYMFGCK